MPNSDEELFRDAVLLVVGQAAIPVDHIVVDGVMRALSTTEAHGFDLGIPEWRSRISIALITLEAKGLVRWIDGGFEVTAEGAERVEAARGCGGVRDQIREALSSFGIELAQTITTA